MLRRNVPDATFDNDSVSLWDSKGGHEDAQNQHRSAYSSLLLAEAS